MANKVHLSPGVYTSEKDLTYNVETIGVTTLGAVGETIKGPAFQPIPVSSYDQFSTVFGGVSPEKFKNTQIVKYELSYIAKSYLSQSNQMYVTRILGLSGYNKGDAFAIKTLGAVDALTNNVVDGNGTSLRFEGTDTGELKVWDSNDSFITAVQSYLSGVTDIPTAKYEDALNAYFAPYNVAVATTKNFWTHDVLYYGTYPTDEKNMYLTWARSDEGNGSDYTNNAPTAADSYGLYPATLPSGDKDAYFTNYEYVYDPMGDKYYTTVFILGTYDVTHTTNYVTGYVDITVLYLEADPIADYHNKLVATLRSKGSYAGNSLSFTASGDTVAFTPAMVDGAAENPYVAFTITGRTSDNAHTIFSHTVSLDSNQSNYIEKVLGTASGEKATNLYVEELYDASLAKGWLNGYVKGLNPYLTLIPTGADGWNHFKFQYQSPATPYFVSELNGGVANQLFRFISISDGDHANTEVKVSIANVDLAKKTFDVIVRQFGDTDKAPSVLERYVNCTMDPNSSTFIGRQIGTVDNEYVSNSSYILVEMAENYGTDSVPAGFEGYEFRTYSGVGVPKMSYKTKYYKAGETWQSNPLGTALISSGDKIKKVYLGLSDTDYGYDTSITSFKGKQNVGSMTYNIGNDWGSKTKGFHMDMNADTTLFEVGDGQFTNPVTLATDTLGAYYDIRTRKFTAFFSGGFDGWDVYRDNRTNGDTYKVGQAGYIAGSFAPTFTIPTYDDDFGSSDYYAYLFGYLTMQNPEQVSINVMVTPGVDIINNATLTDEVITIVEEKRLDSIYIPTIPDINMYSAYGADSTNWLYPQDIAEALDNIGIDSNYTAVFYPFIQITDTENNVYVWIPPTAEVVRNIAYTDNVAFPWYATAGYNRGIVNANRTRIVLSQSDRDILYPARINPIATFTDVGTVIMGNRNLQSANTALSELNVRRLLLQARKLIISVSNRLLFDPNDTTVRSQFTSLVNPILDNIRKERGLSDFRIKLDPVSDTDRTTMRGKIFIKPIDALEFIELEFNVTPNSVSFANI